MTQPNKFQQLLAEKRKREAEDAKRAEASEAGAGGTFDADLIPDTPYERTDTDRDIDAAVATLDIVSAYRRYCGKSDVSIRPGQTESIKLSCPNPSHPDKHPSAWINTVDQVGNCNLCGGFDKFDIAAYHFGFDVPGYKVGANFHRLRERIAEGQGYRIEQHPGGVTLVIPPADRSASGTAEGKPEGGEPQGSSTARGDTVHEAPREGSAEASADTGGSDKQDANSRDNSDSSTGSSPQIGDGPLADVLDLYDDDGELDDSLLPTLDWEKITPPDTFLWQYMQQTRIDDVAEEYHWFNGLLALGFALGRDVSLHDFHPVYGNLFICTLGRSGSGKSKARGYLNKLLASAMPYDHTDPASKGVRQVSAPGSAEVLIHNFDKPIMDPTQKGVIAYRAPVKGMIDFNELSSLVSRSNRTGSAIKPTMMQFYDMETVISTSSMGTGNKEAMQPFGSALTTTQPKALRELVGESDDAAGFLNRWLFVAGKEKKRFAIGGVRVDMKPCEPFLTDIIGWAGSFMGKRYMEWSDEAAARFTEFFHDVIEPAKKRSQNDMLVRVDLLMKKLILLLSANKMNSIVQVEEVEAAIFCYEYIIRCYGIPSGEIGNTLENQISEAVLSAVRRIGGDKGTTINFIAKALKRKKYPKEMLVRNIDALVKLGFLEAYKTEGVGRPTVKYRCVV